jgi:hypothetical protein
VNHKSLLPIALILLFPCLSHSQEAKERGLASITKQAVQGQLEFLASDWTEGRHTGRPGAYMAADYIASLFKVYGLQPGGDTEYIQPGWEERMQGKKNISYETFFQNFDLVEYKPGDHQELSLVTRTGGQSTRYTFSYLTDFSVEVSDVAVEIEAPVVFGGYGYRNEKAGYDDFKGVDVRGRIILCLHGFPGHADTLSNAYKAIRADHRQTPRFIEREKYRIASSLGVAGIIEIGSGEEEAEDWAANLPFRYNSRDYEGDVPRASFYEYRMKIPGDTLEMDPLRLTVSGRVLNLLLKDAGIDLEEFEKKTAANLKPASAELKGKSLHLKTTVDSRLIKARNVIGVLPGKDTSEAIVVGAHYDHLGKHDGWIWNGADDNASGTVGVMTLAKAFMAAGEVPEKTIVFAAWTGEEKGLLGSTYYTGHPWNGAKTLLNLNYDMISRDNKDDTLGIRCSMTYTKNHSILKKLAEKNNQQYGLGLEITFRPSERPHGGSDHTPFAEKGIPIFYFMAGFPPEYHQPNDHTGLVNWDKMVNIIKIGYLSTWDLANSDWGPDSGGANR